jgi:hypothetical protein
MWAVGELLMKELLFGDLYEIQLFRPTEDVMEINRGCSSIEHFAKVIGDSTPVHNYEISRLVGVKHNTPFCRLSG